MAQAHPSIASSDTTSQQVRRRHKAASFGHPNAAKTATALPKLDLTHLQGDCISTTTTLNHTVTTTRTNTMFPIPSSSAIHHYSASFLPASASSDIMVNATTAVVASSSSSASCSCDPLPTPLAKETTSTAAAAAAGMSANVAAVAAAAVSKVLAVNQLLPRAALIRQMAITWVLGIMIPAAALVWTWTQQWTLTLAAALFTPLLAIAQGSLGICTYRLRFGDAPVPLAPSHGVVIATTTCQQNNNKNSNSRDHGTFSTSDHQAEQRQQEQQQQQQQQPPIRLLVIGDSLAIGVGQAQQSTPILPEVIAKTISSQLSKSSLISSLSSSSPVGNRRVVYWTCHGAPGASTGWIVRELERGVTMKSSSSHSNHHQQGASQHSSPRDEDDDEDEDKNDNDSDGQHHRSSSIVTLDGESTQQLIESLPNKLETQSMQSSCSETDDSSSDESSAASDNDNNNRSTRTSSQRLPQQQRQQQQDRSRRNVAHQSCGVVHPTNVQSQPWSCEQLSLRAWRERLARHRQRFHPEVLGPYDVVVIITGSNDLKSAFFPFLLTGDDAEFRRQAQQRGGSYTNELRHLLQTLHGKMRRQWQSWRDTMETAVRETVEETMERLLTSHHHLTTGSATATAAVKTTTTQTLPRSDPVSTHHNNTLTPRPSRLTTDRSNQIASDENGTGRTRRDASGLHADCDYDEFDDDDENEGSMLMRNFPLVVLPGMPSRALPIFQTIPLRWLSVPIVDIMDSHKRALAESHPGQVLFVPAPSVMDLSQYVQQEGWIWQQKKEEETLLNLRDIRQRDSRRIETAMRQYYNHKQQKKQQQQQQQDQPDMVAQSSIITATNKERSWWWCWSSWLWLLSPPSLATQLFSIDQIHPCDEGYDFWGRYIGNAIVHEWQSQQQQQQEQLEQRRQEVEQHAISSACPRLLSSSPPSQSKSRNGAGKKSQ